MRYTSPPDRDWFNAQVWAVVRRVPPGRVITYGQVATQIPPPEGMSPEDYKAWGARWVGGAMANCPPDVPWQRVVNAQGKISLRKGIPPDDPYTHQLELLESEGIVFDERERIDLKRFGWQGESDGRLPGF